MNTSNRFNVETLAGQRQTEIEKYIQQVDQIRNASSLRHVSPSSPQWKVGVASLSILSVIMLVIIAYLY